MLNASFIQTTSESNFPVSIQYLIHVRINMALAPLFDTKTARIMLKFGFHYEMISKHRANTLTNDDCCCFESVLSMIQMRRRYGHIDNAFVPNIIIDDSIVSYLCCWRVCRLLFCNCIGYLKQTEIWHGQHGFSMKCSSKLKFSWLLLWWLLFQALTFGCQLLFESSVKISINVSVNESHRILFSECETCENDECR